MSYELGRELFVFLCVTPDSLCVTLCNKRTVTEKHRVKRRNTENGTRKMML
jgi:hypothetical protein